MGLRLMLKFVNSFADAIEFFIQSSRVLSLCYTFDTCHVNLWLDCSRTGSKPTDHS